jgi:hypothetical protein
LAAGERLLVKRSEDGLLDVATYAMDALERHLQSFPVIVGSC